MDKKLIFKKMADYWNNDMPFNQLLGLKIQHFDVQRAEIRFLWQDKLIGNSTQKILRGGVTASALDLARSRWLEWSYTIILMKILPLVQVFIPIPLQDACFRVCELFQF